MNAWSEVISEMHASPYQAVLAVTGGGSGAIGQLLSVPGASRTLLEARVPYAHAALVEWLGCQPEQNCSRETALAMATVAWRRAERLGPPTDPNSLSNPHVVGLGCTAALASDRPKRGAHRCWIATHSLYETRLVTLTLAKGARPRNDEETIVSHLVLQALADAFGIPATVELELLDQEQVVCEKQSATPALVRLVAGECSVLWSQPDGSFVERVDQPPAGLLCGAFNPLHIGHRKLVEAAERALGGPVWCELTVFNADKPPLDYLTLDKRLRQFTDIPLVLSRAATFAEKARFFPNTVFVIGVDTAERVVQPRFYGADVEKMRQALDTIRSRGCRFLVAGRQKGSQFRVLAQVDIPQEFADLFQGLTEAAFRQDVSSTELRAADRKKRQNP